MKSTNRCPACGTMVADVRNFIDVDGIYTRHKCRSCHVEWQNGRKRRGRKGSPKPSLSSLKTHSEQALPATNVAQDGVST